MNLNWKKEKKGKNLQRKEVLLILKKTQQNDKKRTKEERDLHSKFKPFFRFSNPDEYNEFIQGLLTEKKLKESIKQLQTYRSLGIQTTSQAEKYESLKKRRGIQKLEEKDTDLEVEWNLMNNQINISQIYYQIKKKKYVHLLKFQ